MANTVKIYLKLVRKEPDIELQWSSDQRSWSKVTPTSPSTVVDSDEEVDWVADKTIEKIQIKFNKGNIISNSDIRDNDSKEPKGQVKNEVSRGLSDSYTIKVQPIGSGALKEYDPGLETPPPDGDDDEDSSSNNPD